MSNNNNLHFLCNIPNESPHNSDREFYFAFIRDIISLLYVQIARILKCLFCYRKLHVCNHYMPHCPPKITQTKKALRKSMRRAAVMSVLSFCVVCLSYRSRELVGAGCRLSSAGVAAQLALDLVNGHAVHQLWDSLKVSVAAAQKANIAHHVAVQIKLNFHGANASCFVSVFHRYPPLTNFHLTL